MKGLEASEKRDEANKQPWKPTAFADMYFSRVLFECEE